MRIRVDSKVSIFSRKGFYALGLLLLFAILAILALKTLLNQENVFVPRRELPAMTTTKPSYLISDNYHIYQTSDLFNVDALIKTYTYDEVLDLVETHAVVTKGNKLHYIQFDNEGNIAREISLGTHPDLVLSMSQNILLYDKEVLFLYVIPLRGFRLIRIAADNTYTENYYPIAEFFRLFSDNSVFITGTDIIIPNGGLNTYVIDLISGNVISEPIMQNGCGKGNWEIHHNADDLFVLKSDLNICIYNYSTQLAVTSLPLSGSMWFKIFPKSWLLAVEPWETLANLPSSAGRIDFYDLHTSKQVATIDISENRDFQDQRSTSPGGYSLLGGSYFNPSQNEFFLSTRAGMQTFVLCLDSNLDFVKFVPAPHFHLDTLTILSSNSV